MRSWRLYWVRHQVPEQSKGYELRPCLQNERNRGRKRGGEKRVEGGKGKENKCTWYKNRKNFMPNIILSLNSRVRITIIVHTFFPKLYISELAGQPVSLNVLSCVYPRLQTHQKTPKALPKTFRACLIPLPPQPYARTFLEKNVSIGACYIKQKSQYFKILSGECKFIIKERKTFIQI